MRLDDTLHCAGAQPRLALLVREFFLGEICEPAIGFFARHRRWRPRLRLQKGRLLRGVGLDSATGRQPQRKAESEGDGERRAGRCWGTVHGRLGVGSAGL